MDEIISTLFHNGFKFNEIIFESQQSLILKIYSYVYQKYFVAKVLNIFSSDVNSPSNDCCRGRSNIATFTAEVKSLSKVYHPHVINIYEQFTDDKHLYIVLEYCPGGSTLDYLKTNKVVPECLLLEWMRQTVDALCKCHSRGISHRDIKPSNILLDEHNRIKLADFGLSFSGEKRQMLMRFGGSLPYSAPEILSGKKHDPFKADIWSLGITFYVLAFSRLPYNPSTEEELKYQILSSIIEVPETHNPSISKVIRLMLNRNPDYRISCGDIIEHKLLNKKEDHKSHSKPLTKLSRRLNCCCSTQHLSTKLKLNKGKNVNSASSIRDTLKHSLQNTF
jgi:serine/threonine protein kinase